MARDSDEMTVDSQLTEATERLRVSSVEDEDYEEDYEFGDERADLGLVKDPAHKWSLTRQYFPSKAGGVPAWLDPVDIPTGRSSMCDICGVPLQFLLQIYAPFPHKESAFHRTLFVFVCTSLSCLIQHLLAQRNCYQKKTSRSVKVFRCQLPLMNPFYSHLPPNPHGTATPLCVGAVLCDWCGSWKGDRECSSCKTAFYCSDIHRSECCELTSLLSDGSSSANSKAVPTDGQKETPAVASKLLWPEKEIVTADEDGSESNEDAPQNKFDIDSYVPDDGLDDDSTKAFMDALEGDGDNKSWASFLERIGKSSKQVLRYWRSREAKPLWPIAIGRPSKSDIPKCNHCGGELIFEFQIMPQLLHYLGVKNDADYIDWGTIAVYTCQASCDGGPSYKDEFAWVQPYF